MESDTSLGVGTFAEKNGSDFQYKLFKPPDLFPV
jgi:hypothetical protein